ncbi:MAG: chorismate mutase [Thermoplasmata archaeon]
MTRSPRAKASLAAYRREIAEIDRGIVLLLADRWATVRETMGFKRSRHLPLFDEAQEERVLARSRRWARELDLSAPVVDRLFRSIMEEGRRRAVLPEETRRPEASREAPSSERPSVGIRRKLPRRQNRSRRTPTKGARSAERGRDILRGVEVPDRPKRARGSCTMRKSWSSI